MTTFHVQEIINYYFSNSQLYIRAKVQPRILNPKDSPPGVPYVRYDLPRIEDFLWEDFELLSSARDAFLTGFKPMAAEQVVRKTSSGLFSCFRLWLVSSQSFHSVVLISTEVNNYWTHHKPRSRCPGQDCINLFTHFSPLSSRRDILFP